MEAIPVTTPAAKGDAATRRVAPALRCAQCEYDLSGLDPLGRCPECALPIEKSLRGADRLEFADPRWLRTMGSGAAVLALATMCLSYTATATALILFIAGLAGPSLPMVASAFSAIMVTLACVGGLGAAFGMWFLTVREPRRGYRGPGSRARMVARLPFGIIAFALCGTLAAELLTGTPFSRAGFSCLFTLGIIAIYPGTIGAYNWVAVLARRADRADLAERARRLRNAFAILTPVLVLLTPMVGLFLAACRLTGPFALGILACVPTLPISLFGFMSAQFLWRLRSAIAHARLMSLENQLERERVATNS